MPLFSRMQTEQLKQTVLDCTIRRFTAYETQVYIKDKLGIDLSFGAVKNYRSKQRQDAQKWIAKLAKSRKADYIAEYKQRVDEVYRYQHKLWELIEDDKTYARTKVEAVHTLLQCTQQLIELYDSLPLLSAMRDYDRLQEHTEDISSNSETETSEDTDYST